MATNSTIRPEIRGGRYQLLEPFPCSSRTQVFLAHDELLERSVVIKFFHEQPDAFDEARATIQARHPGVVHVHDAGTHDDRGYIVFEFCEEGTLLEWSAARSWHEVLDRILEAGAALAHCHGRLLVHGDVKPTNILINHGHALLADFGLAGPPDLVLHFSGTPGYIAPELTMGRRSPSNDVFALACTAWVCLFGSRPHAGESASALLLAAEERAVPWPSTVPPSMPPGVVRAIARGLEPNQRDRPTLPRWMSEIRLAARPRWPWPCLPRWRARRYSPPLGPNAA